jgi:thiol-disulfide isomerase/thioredoxin
MKTVLSTVICALMIASISSAFPPSRAYAEPTLQTAPASLASLKSGENGTVLFFVAHDCPISNGYAPEMNRLETAYSSKGVGFYLVYAEKDFTAAQAQAHYDAYGYKFPALLDTRFSLAREARATVTPEAVLLDPSGHVRYRGAIDNLYADFGVKRQRATEFPLRAALDAFLAGRPMPSSDVKDVGCYLSTE